jgi:hypothetical protein
MVLDSLGQIPELIDDNNTITATIEILPSSDIFPPSFVEGPINEGWGTHAFIRFLTSEPAHSMVMYGTTYALGATVVGDSIVFKHDIMLTGLSTTTRYYFQVQIADTVGNALMSALDSLDTGAGPLSEGPGLPGSVSLSAAYPNPARSSVSFALALPSGSPVEFSIYDLQGRLVHEESGDRGAGRHTLTWRGSSMDGAPVQPGVYLAIVRAAGLRFNRRLVLIR